MILPFDETGHFTCSQKRTFSLANDTSTPTPVSEHSLKKRLVFSGLRQGFRSKFLFQTSYLQILDIKGVMPLFSVCEGYFADQIHENKALSFRACLCAAS
jgi:hypothetical protein